MVAQNEPYESPAIRAYAITLTSWRERAGLSKTQLSESLGYTAQLIGQIEGAKNIPSKKLSEDLDTFFKSSNLFVELWTLINNTRHLIALPPGFSKYVELEAKATKVSKFEALLISGLFQTEEYARAIMSSFMTPDVIEEALQARMARREIFDRPASTPTFFIVDEWALRRVIGSPEITGAQLDYLHELSTRPNINIQVLPHDTEHYVAFSGSFTILGLDDEPDVAYIEAAGQGNLITGPASVAHCTMRYDLLRGHAYSVAESRRVIRTIMESL
ncbi:helix-turn-helix transcriptional regulator [Actinomadura sp. DC4]|uniref:helix-turn-helix domain-containing protein n=1 Tax=Actinomadura sp. DC4 TaxID=3055069 RepID=UPI0025B13CE1|nr:helix-turn-helix transcriptional regulator [Actinomadura sp. DC4]MDN3354247.1 helix-turn-helix transcriptional regulator [Actinomadura sp. DC4]